MIFLEESSELIRVLEFSQGLFFHNGNVQVPRKLSLLKEVFGGYRLCLPAHDMVNKISHLCHQGLDPLVATLQLALQLLNLLLQLRNLYGLVPLEYLQFLNMALPLL